MNENIIIIGDFEFPTKCPINCPGHSFPFAQGGLCYRCPIFNCRKVGGSSLLEPEDYRKDWAEAWYEWFNNDMKGFPELYLKQFVQKRNKKMKIKFGFETDYNELWFLPTFGYSNIIGEKFMWFGWLWWMFTVRF